MFRDLLMSFGLLHIEISAKDGKRIEYVKGSIEDIENLIEKSKPMNNITEPEIKNLEDILLCFGEAHNMLAKTSLSKEEYQPISGLLAKAKVELFNFCNDHKAALQNKVSDLRLLELIRKVTDILEVMDLKDINRKALLKIKMGLQSILQENKVSDISAEEILYKHILADSEKQMSGDKRLVIKDPPFEEIIKNPTFQMHVAAMEEYASIVNERKDNVGVWVKASARLPEKLAYYNCKFRGIPIIFYIDSRNETISDDSQIIDKKYWKFTQWLDESQPKQKEVDEYEDEMPPL